MNYNRYFYCVIVFLGHVLLSRFGECGPPVLIENPEAYNCINNNTSPEDLNILNIQYAPFLRGESLLQYIRGLPGPTNLGPLNEIVSGNPGDSYATLLANLTAIQITLAPGMPLVTTTNDLNVLAPPDNVATGILGTIQVQVPRLGMTPPNPNATFTNSNDALSIALLGNTFAHHLLNDVNLVVHNLQGGVPLDSIPSNLGSIIGDPIFPPPVGDIHGNLQAIEAQIGVPNPVTIASDLTNATLILQNVFEPLYTAIQSITAIVPPGSNSDVLSGLTDTQAVIGFPPNTTTLPDQVTAILNELNVKVAGGPYTDIWTAVQAIP